MVTFDKKKVKTLILTVIPISNGANRVRSAYVTDAMLVCFHQKECHAVCHSPPNIQGHKLDSTQNWENTSEPRIENQVDY